jgi:predicted hydrocarbon binding protein
VSTPPNILAPLGLDRLIAGWAFASDGTGRWSDATGTRIVFAAPEMIRGLHHVIEREQGGAWRVTMQACGLACGRRVARDLETKLAAAGKPALATLPLEACLALLERTFAAHGLGSLTVDLAPAAEHGLVVARVEHSFWVEALPQPGGFVDAMLGGMLQGFFEHVTGQTLACEEIGCASHGAAHCTFVITAPEKIATITAHLGRESAESILAQLMRQ